MEVIKALSKAYELTNGLILCPSEIIFSCLNIFSKGCCTNHSKIREKSFWSLIILSRQQKF